MNIFTAKENAKFPFIYLQVSEVNLIKQKYKQHADSWSLTR